MINKNLKDTNVYIASLLGFFSAPLIISIAESMIKSLNFTENTLIPIVILSPLLLHFMWKNEVINQILPKEALVRANILGIILYMGIELI